MMRKITFFLYVTFFCVVNMMAQVTFDFSTAQRGPVIGSLHYGIFYEEINHAGDGGLYAELIRNGSMEENANNPDYWWTIGNATFSISSQNLINAAQKRAMHLNLTKAGDGTRNIGYWGINVVKGQKYRASFWLRTAGNWTGDITLTLENDEGADLGHAVVKVSDGSTWKKYSADIIATGNAKQGWFAIRGSRAGTIYLDCVSLMPPTFKNRENGMRPDLAEKLAALHPRIMRFPGGCYIEGGNRYQWRH
ncbi:MAG: carbohydrate binding domain-containing protein, partial [Prevotella sp.]|nr:carbohydrate binding domain-containing protein [Prevotella sp.]